MRAFPPFIYDYIMHIDCLFIYAYFYDLRITINHCMMLLYCISVQIKDERKILYIYNFHYCNFYMYLYIALPS